MRCLLVESSAHLAATACRDLRPDGLIVDYAADAQQALGLLAVRDYEVMIILNEDVRARLKTLCRRAFDESATKLQIGPLTLDTVARIACVNDAPLPLTPKEYVLLEVLARSRGCSLSRAALFHRLYESDSDVSDLIIHALVSNLRAKLAKSGCRSFIETRHGFGYRLAITIARRGNTEVGSFLAERSSEENSAL